MICIAQSHPIICEKKIISKINFQGDGWSRLENTVTGKNKRVMKFITIDLTTVVVGPSYNEDNNLTFSIPLIIKLKKKRDYFIHTDY